MSAGSFRNSAFVDSLLKVLPEGSEINVVTTLPNRYAGFSAEAPEEEASPQLTVKRVSLPAHESGMTDQSRAFLTYARQVKAFVKRKKYDAVYASSSRLMTAVLGASIARKQRVPLYLDVRDIFLDTINDVLPRKITWLIKPFFSVLERWAISRADRLNMVSAGFLPYFESRYPTVSKVVFTNGIDDEFLNVAHQTCTTENDLNAEEENQLVEVVYAGNMGEGQGLHNIIPELAMRLEGRARFRLIGGGGRLRQLETAIAERGCTNVLVESPVARDELIDIYLQADVLFLHLNDYEAFRKVLPSKLFEYGALGKPIWAGVAGYAAEFVNENLENAEVFPPCDVAGALAAFKRLRIADKPRDEFVTRYARDGIMDDMAKDLRSLVLDKRPKSSSLGESQ